MNYKQSRSYLNCELAIFQSEYNEGFPQLLSCETDIDSANMIDFNNALHITHPEDKICHFFIDDHLYEKVWNLPKRYINLFSKFKAVIAPNFEICTNYPLVIQQFNHYRNLWLCRFFQSYGVNIIPNISFSDETSLSWIFKGQPHNSLYCINTTKYFQQELYLKYIKHAITTLKPSSLLIYGKLHNELVETLKYNGFNGKIIIGTQVPIND